SNLFDLRAADRLPVRNDRQRLERGRRQSLGTGGKLCTLDGLGVFGACKDLPAAGNFLKLDTVPLDVVMLANLLQRRGERGGRRLGIERRQLLGGDRTGARKERGLKQLR